MKPGIYSISMEAYLALPALSSGLCHTILTQSPLHAWCESALNPARVREDSSVMDIGTLAHAVLLEGGTNKLVEIDPEDYPSKTGSIPDGWTNKAIRQARDDARARGFIPVFKKDVNAVTSMVNAARAYVAGSEIKGVFDTGAPEQTLIWSELFVGRDYEQLNAIYKARADWLTADRSICLSYKTTAGSANPDAWIRTQLPSHDIATVFYERAVLEACPEVQSTRCVHLVQEQSPPYACSLVGLDPTYAQLAERKLARAMQLWAHCLKTGKWPAYPSRIAWAVPKPWDQQQFDEQEIARGQLTEGELEGGIPL